MMDSIKGRMEFILSHEEMDRIQFQKVAGKKIEVVADVHGMKCAYAKRFLKNIIAIIRDEFFVLVIHGYNHGCVIKDMIRTDILSTRVIELMSVQNNMGRTLISIGNYI